VAASQIEDLRGDPADRLLVATALARRVQMVTKDRLLHAHAATAAGFGVIW
jgi:PIN domain nuclease of toxin-antitoxin system